MALVIDEFRGEHAFLSNFYPVDVLYEGIVYRTAEHAYQAAKSLDPDVRWHVAVQRNARDAKRVARGIIDLRPSWNEGISYEVMTRVIALKFGRTNPDLVRKLLETGDATLIEGNTWHDNVWGSCTCETVGHNGTGLNMLGKILMARRAELHGGA